MLEREIQKSHVFSIFLSLKFSLLSIFKFIRLIMLDMLTFLDIGHISKLFKNEKKKKRIIVFCMFFPFWEILDFGGKHKI